MKIPNIVFFDKQIQTIKNTLFKQYCLDFFNLKTIMMKTISFFVITLICGLAFFLMRHHSLVDHWDNVVFNTGFAWGIGKDWPAWVGYLTKLIPIALLLIVMLIYNDWYLYIPVTLVFVNSVFNVIDKGMVDVYNGITYYDAVVDNIPWLSLGFTNNIADIFIIAGVVIAVIGFIWEIKKSFDERKHKDNEQEHNCPEI